MAETKKGLQAKSITLLTQAPVSPFKFFYVGAFAIFLFVFVSIVYYTSVATIVAYLAGINIAAFVIFSYDKGVAGSSASRVPEAVLYFLALLGGSPAILLAMQMVRHKTQKSAFQLTLFLIIAVQIVFLKYFGESFGLITW